MNDVYEAAMQVQEVFERQSWRFCLIGGLAVIRWGNPRTTQDADFSLLAGFGDEDQFLEVLGEEFTEREPGEHEFAKKFRVYRGAAPNGAAVDIALAGQPFEIEMIGRTSDFEF